MVTIPKNPETTSGSGSSGNVLDKLKDVFSADKLKNFLTLGGDAEKWKRATIVSVAVIAIMGLLSIGIWGVALAFYVRSIGEPRSGSVATAGACYLKNEAFTAFDESTVGNTDWVLNKLDKYNIRRDKADMVIRKSLDQSIAGQKVNPAIMMAIWSGEASYRQENDERAFGCTVYDHNGDGVTDNDFPSFSGQTECSKDRVVKAITGTAPYNQPTGESIFTRLFWNYTGAMKEVYQTKGYVADASNPRIVILKLLVPDDVVCNEFSSGGVVNGNRIILDPGHGSGGNRFTRSANGVSNEGDHNWLIANKVKANLETAGFEVVFTKDSADSNPALPQRVSRANASGAAFLISFHSNAKGGVGPIGIVYCDGPSDGEVNYKPDTCANDEISRHGRDMSHAVVRNIVSNLGLTNPRYWGGDLGALTGLNMPSMLVEMFAHDQVSDLEKIDGKADLLAKSISDGILTVVKKN